MGEPIIRVENLCKNFGGVKAVDMISFTLDRNRILGVIGPNGSGKTTLVNLITGFVKPDSSSRRVLYQGRVIVTGWPAHTRSPSLGVARTFQMVKPVLPVFPAFKNLIVPLTSSPRVKKLAGGKPTDDRDAVALDLLEEVGFERDALGRLQVCGLTSPGVSQAAGTGQAAWPLRPDLIILDELFSGLSAWPRWRASFPSSRSSSAPGKDHHHDRAPAQGALPHCGSRSWCSTSAEKIAEGAARSEVMESP